MFNQKTWKKYFALAVILMLTISCNLPIGELARQELQEGLLMVTPDVINAQIEAINEEVAGNFEGTRRYTLTPPKGAVNDKNCDTGHLTGPEATTSNSLIRSKDPQDYEFNTVTIEENGVTYVYKQVVPNKPNVFCRTTENFLVECVSLKTNGYSIEVFNEPTNGSYYPFVFNEVKPCYEMNFDFLEDLIEIPIPEPDIPDSGDWTAKQCDASADMDIRLYDLQESSVYDEKSGELEYLGCEYQMDIQNIGETPFSPLFLKLDAYEDKDQTAWGRIMTLNPGEVFSLGNDMAKYGENELPFVYVYYQIGAIYDVPECGWIRHGDISEAARNLAKIVKPPCKDISPFEGRIPSASPPSYDDD